jgi:hypothetical protein
VGLAVVVVVMGGGGMGIDVVVEMDATSIVVRTAISDVVMAVVGGSEVERPETPTVPADMIIVVWGGTG